VLNDRNRIIEFAIVGAAASAICVATPLGEWLLRAVGLEDWIASLRQVLLPLTALFVGLGVGTAWFRSRDSK